VISRLVVIAPNWLGDAVMALPALTDLRRHFSGAHLAVAARPSVAPVFSMVEGVDEVVELPGGGGWRALTGWRTDAQALAPGRYDAAVLFPNSFAAAYVAAKAGIAERWGFATDWRGGLLTRVVPRPGAEVHQRAYYQAMTTALGMEEGPHYARVSPDRDRARQLLREIGLDVDEPFVVFAPGAAYGGAKQWLPSRYAELARRIIGERGWSVLMVGTSADRAACDQVAALVPRVGTRVNRLIDFCGKSDLVTLAGILSQARAVVSNDSGAMHLAAAVGTRVIAIFGPTRERQTLPLPSGPEGPRPVVITHDVFCRPCMLRECPIDHRCMTRISAGEMLGHLT
jgi:heptosyltransferase-2